MWAGRLSSTFAVPSGSSSSQEWTLVCWAQALPAWSPDREQDLPLALPGCQPGKFLPGKKQIT